MAGVCIDGRRPMSSSESPNPNPSSGPKNEPDLLSTEDERGDAWLGSFDNDDAWLKSDSGADLEEWR